jgi:hypothetical protein
MYVEISGLGWMLASAGSYSLAWRPTLYSVLVGL